jgi:hypothetical protein
LGGFLLQANHFASIALQGVFVTELVLLFVIPVKLENFLQIQARQAVMFVHLEDSAVTKHLQLVIFAHLGSFKVKLVNQPVLIVLLENSFQDWEVHSVVCATKECLHPRNQARFARVVNLENSQIKREALIALCVLWEKKV